MKSDTTDRMLLASLLQRGGGAAILLLAVSLAAILLHIGPVGPGILTLSDVPGSLGRGEPVGFLQLSLVFLIWLPVIRTLVMTVLFLRERDFLYTTLSLTILAVLLIGLVS